MNKTFRISRTYELDVTVTDEEIESVGDPDLTFVDVALIIAEDVPESAWTPVASDIVEVG